MSGAGIAAVSYREDGEGRPCLAAIGLSTERPRYCLGDDLNDTEVRWKRVQVPFDGGGDDLVLMFASPEVHDIELVSRPGDTMSREKVVRTETSDQVRFSAYWHQDDRLVLDQVIGHRSAAEPSEGLTPPKNKAGYTSVVRATGRGFEQFVPGKQGPGYLLDLTSSDHAVTHRLNGTAQPCVTITPGSGERVCFTGWKRDERLQSTIEELGDGRILVAGFARLDVERVQAYAADGKTYRVLDVYATPTSQELSFFAGIFDPADLQPVEMKAGTF